MGQNPYQTPQANIIVDLVPGSMEELRNTYLQHEGTVRSLGIFYYMMAIILFVTGAIAIAYAFTTKYHAMDIRFALFLLFLGFIYLWLAPNMRKLKNKAKLPAAFLSFIGLMLFPLGTILHAYILYLLLSKKGHMMFSDAYQAAIDATPQIKYSTPLLLWGFVGIPMFLILLSVIFAPPIV